MVALALSWAIIWLAPFKTYGEDYSAGMGVLANRVPQVPYSKKPKTETVLRKFNKGTKVTGQAVYPMTLNLNITCYGVNNRGVAYPLYPDDNILVYLSFGPQNNLIVEYPASQILQRFDTKAKGKVYYCQDKDFATCWETAKDGQTAGAVNTQDLGRMISMTMVVPLEEGYVNLDESKIQFRQTKATSSYLNHFDAALAPQVAAALQAVDANYAADFHYLTPKDLRVYREQNAVSVSLGVYGLGLTVDGKKVVDNTTWFNFCGSFRSPLMLFFNESLPSFSHYSNFPLRPGAEVVTWPEKGNHAYFLFDAQKEACVKYGTQLFGENPDYANGFEALRVWDSNKDGQIDRKDQNFKHLALWNDKNGDGICTADEVASLSKQGVQGISLVYRSIERKFGDNAKALEKASFRYKKGKKVEKGEIYDIWLNVIKHKD
ncbi:MAG: hypothetical protein J6Y94_06670 [Bacteriovoracaceae bacterium]|nr:hypothetical protein [Bacteriovoracaceae bacterium]